MKDIIQTPNVLLFDTSLLLRETLVVLGEAEDRFVHSVLWSLGSPIPPSLTRFMAPDVKTPQMSAFCLVVYFPNRNIFQDLKPKNMVSFP